MKRIRKILCALCCVAFVFSVFALFGSNQEPVFAENVTSWEMQNGASIRIGEPNGIRFSAQVNESEYNDYLTDTETKEVKFGMVIIPNSYLTTYGEISEKTLFGNGAERLYWWNNSNKDENLVQIRLFEVDDLKTVQNGKYLFNCALTNVKVENYEMDFYARAYYSITENGETKYYFTSGNEDVVRSPATVAERAISLSQDKNSETYGKYSNSISALAKYGMSVGNTIDTVTGNIVTDTNAIACSYFLKTEEISEISVANGYNIVYVGYNASKTQVVDLETSTYFRFAIIKNSEATNDDLSNVNFIITSKQTIRDLVMVDGKVVNRANTGAIESIWTVDGETITSSGNTGREVKWFGKTGSAYTVETTISNLDEINSSAGIVISSGEETKAFILMPFMSGTTKMVGRLHVGLPTWEASWFSGTGTQFVEGEEFTIKLVNDGETLTVYVNDVVMPTTFSSSDYSNLIGTNNAIGLIALNEQVVFKNTVLTFDNQKEVKGNVSVANGINEEYDLTKTVIYAHTLDRVVKYNGVVDANGNFVISVPNDTQSFEFVNEVFINETIEFTEDITAVFDKPVILKNSVVLNGEIITSANVANGGNDTVWEYTENTATTQGVGREVKWFANTGNVFTVETEILGHNVNDKSAGIAIATANKTYVVAINPIAAGAARYVYNQFPSGVGSFAINGPLTKSSIGYYKIKIVCDGSTITVYMGSGEDTSQEITNMTTITTLNGSSTTITSQMIDIIGKDVAIGLASIGGAKVTFRNFSLTTSNVPLTQYATVNNTTVGVGVVGGSVVTSWTLGENTAAPSGITGREVRWFKGTGTTYSVETEILNLTANGSHAGLAFTIGTKTYAINIQEIGNATTIGRMLMIYQNSSTEDQWLRVADGKVVPKSSVGYYKIKVVYDGTNLSIYMGSANDTSANITDMYLVDMFNTGGADVSSKVSDILGQETAIGLFVRSAKVTFRNYSVTFGI